MIKDYRVKILRKNEGKFNKLNKPNRVAEIVESSSLTFKAQTDDLYTSPSMGSLVSTTENNIMTLALVEYIETNSIDPGRIAIAQDKTFTSSEEIYSNHPELHSLLRTIFFARVIGHINKDVFYPNLPETPPKIHSLVEQCDSHILKQVAESKTIIANIVQAKTISGDDFIVASLKTLSLSSTDQEEYLINCGRVLVELLYTEQQRLNLILAKLNPQQS